MEGILIFLKANLVEDSFKLVRKHAEAVVPKFLCFLELVSIVKFCAHSLGAQQDRIRGRVLFHVLSKNGFHC